MVKMSGRVIVLDKVDLELISALRRDARASLSELAQKLGLSRTTVRARMERLAASGEILGFTVVLKEDVADHPVRGLMMLGIEGRGADRIVRQLNGMPAVQAIHTTNGKWDLVLELGTPSLEALDAVLSQIRRFDGVVTSETNLLLATRKSAKIR
ncbi:Leucine-responsive regulatory protein [Pseudoruegeria aquimaris]|uniref:Leucine-responsive regulatory protein n=1 Tax=Pseudoruegeria aquimaris TaxID=393663 RepID=A0A1Y5RI92_9RHOB|nr:Leucine-responsive regulatory protein [Pseudoruegeria aquimaris]